jgi:hypothetical protein
MQNGSLRYKIDRELAGGIRAGDWLIDGFSASLE